MLSMIQKAINLLGNKLKPEERVKTAHLFGRYATILGLSLIISYFVSNFLKGNLTNYYDLIKNLKGYSIIWVFVGVYIIFLGLSTVASIGTEEKMNMNENNWKILFKILPFSIPFGITVVYLSYPLWLKDTEWITRNFYIIAIANTIAIYCILTVCTNMIENIFKIFKGSVSDSKDRLTIVVTIFATIISAIALFK